MQIQNFKTFCDLVETKSFSKALANLEDLADLLLCKQQHNNHEKPHLNQINEVSRKWYAVAKREYISLKNEAERAAERRAARELSSMREAAQLMRDELQRERDNMVRGFGIHSAMTGAHKFRRLLR